MGGTMNKTLENKMYGLRFDTNFKNVFRNKNFLKQFLKDIFHEEIGNITYIDKEVLKENKYLSYSIFDLLVKAKDEFIILEMQNQDLKNIEARVAMYLSKYYARQNAGKKYQNIKPVKMKLILNYPYGKKEVLKEYQAMEKRLLEQFGIYFDMKIWNIGEALKKQGTLDYQYALLFMLDTFRKEKAEQILRMLKQEKKFVKVVHKIELYNADLATYEKLKNEEERQMKLEDVAEAYKKEGIKIGKKKGEALGEKRGEKLGEKRGIMKTAILMLKEGLDLSLIKKITGLTETEILGLEEK